METHSECLVQWRGRTGMVARCRGLADDGRSVGMLVTVHSSGTSVDGARYRRCATVLSLVGTPSRNGEGVLKIRSAFTACGVRGGVAPALEWSAMQAA